MTTESGHIRVLHVLHGLNRAGAEQLVFNLAMEGRRSMATAVACLDEEGPLASDLRREGMPVYWTRRREGLDLRQIFRIAAIIRAFDPHVVHCHQYTPFFYGRLAAGWARRGRVLFTEHGRHVPDIVSVRRRLINRFLVRGTDRITGVCEFSRRCLVEREGLPADRIETIYNGVDVARFEGRDRQACRRMLDLPGEQPIAIHVGTLRPVKDHATSLRAFARVRQACPDAVLLLVGDGPERAACERLAVDLGIGQAVRFLGQRSDIPELLGAADVLVMTSVSEAHSVSLLEAMAAGLPVVATRVGGNPETVLDGQTGFLADSGDVDGIAAAIVRLLRDDELRRRMGHAGRDRVRAYFTQSAMHERYMAIYRELAGRKPGR